MVILREAQAKTQTQIIFLSHGCFLVLAQTALALNYLKDLYRYLKCFLVLVQTALYSSDERNFVPPKRERERERKKKKSR